MTAIELINKINFNSAAARSIARNEYDAPYASVDALGFAAIAARTARQLLATTTKGVILDPLTDQLREGFKSECGFGEVYFPPQHCESLIRYSPTSSERATSRNRLRVDAMQPGLTRCINRPENPRIDPIRWLGSGGGSEVFKPCIGRANPSCPLNQ